jgi:hypothetical protein
VRAVIGVAAPLTVAATSAPKWHTGGKDRHVPPTRAAADAIEKTWPTFRFVFPALDRWSLDGLEAASLARCCIRNTVYAAGYTDRAFPMVRAGMTDE